MRVRGGEGPEADCVVGGGGGDEGVVAWAEIQGCDGAGVAFEVAQVLVVVGGEVADCVVGLCGGVDDGLAVVREAREVAAVFFGEEGLFGAAFAAVVELECFVREGGEEEVAGVVEGEGCGCCGGRGEFELLGRGLAGKRSERRRGVRCSPS